MLDIGGEVGAAIVHAPAALAGREIEIRRRRHLVGRHPRGGPGAASRGGVFYAALFPGFARGSYEVRVRGDAEGPVAAVEVEGGKVSEARSRSRRDPRNVDRSPPIEAVPTGSLTATDRKAHDPEDRKDDGDDPEKV